MKRLLGPLLVTQMARKGLWNAGSGGNRQEILVVRGFLSLLQAPVRIQTPLQG